MFTVTRSKMLVLTAVLITALLAIAAGDERAVNGKNVHAWTPSDAMLDARTGACSALLLNGQILVSGGSNAQGVLASAEVLGVRGTFSGVSPMHEARQDHACAALSDGTFLVAGGRASGGGVTN